MTAEKPDLGAWAWISNLSCPGSFTLLGVFVCFFLLFFFFSETLARKKAYKLLFGRNHGDCASATNHAWGSRISGDRGR